MRPASIPSYTEAAWIFGARLRAPEPLDEAQVAALSEAMCNAAETRGLSPATLHGAYGAPFVPEDEVIVGAVLNGAPVVRDTAEMREGVLSRHHSAVQSRFELSARAHHSSDEDLSVEESWTRNLAEAIDGVRAASPFRLAPVAETRGRVRPELATDEMLDGDCAWHLVLRAGAETSAAFVFGAILPTPGGSYEDDMIETFECRDGSGDVIARLIGVRLLAVDPESPSASLSSWPSQAGWRSDVYQRIERLTGKARATNHYLVG